MGEGMGRGESWRRGKIHPVRMGSAITDPEAGSKTALGGGKLDLARRSLMEFGQPKLEAPNTPPPGIEIYARCKSMYPCTHVCS